MKALPFLPLLGLIFVLGAGCGGAKEGQRSQMAKVAFEGEQDQKQQAGKGADQDGKPELLRKIKHTATISLITDEFDKGHESLKQLVKTHRGYFANTETSGAPGAGRHGFWKVRVPVKEFDAFREAVLKIAEVEKNASDSEDVTEEYYDLENHIKNKLAEEESLRRLLEKIGDKEKMENILTIRRELSSVRDEIQRKQGRLKLLENLTEMTTVSVTIRERQKYDPAKGPDLAEIPTFGQRIGRTFGNSWEALSSFGQFLFLMVVGVTPWSPIILAFLLPGWWWYRRQKKGGGPIQATPAASQSPAH